jgi:hypothetical protein
VAATIDAAEAAVRTAVPAALVIYLKPDLDRSRWKANTGKISPMVWVSLAGSINLRATGAGRGPGATETGQHRIGDNFRSVVLADPDGKRKRTFALGDDAARHSPLPHITSTNTAEYAGLPVHSKYIGVEHICI